MHIVSWYHFDHTSYAWCSLSFLECIVMLLGSNLMLLFTYWEVESVLYPLSCELRDFLSGSYLVLFPSTLTGDSFPSFEWLPHTDHKLSTNSQGTDIVRLSRADLDNQLCFLIICAGCSLEWLHIYSAPRFRVPMVEPVYCAFFNSSKLGQTHFIYFWSLKDLCPSLPCV